MWLYYIYIGIFLSIIASIIFTIQEILERKKEISLFKTMDKKNFIIFLLVSNCLIIIVVTLFYSILIVVILVARLYHIIHDNLPHVIKKERENKNYWQEILEKSHLDEIKKKENKIRRRLLYEGFEAPQFQIIKNNTYNKKYKLENEYVFYVESEYNLFLNDYFNKNYEKIKNIFSTEIISQKYIFVYIPLITDKLTKEMFAYHNPHLSAENEDTKKIFDNLSTALFTNHLLDMLEYEGKRYAGLLQCIGSWDFRYTPINVNTSLDMDKFFYWYIDNLCGVSCFEKYQYAKINNKITNFKFDMDKHEIAQDIKEKIDTLKASGYHHLLMNIVGETMKAHEEEIQAIQKIGNITLSRLLIDKDFRIFLLDYQNIEVIMTPLPKAIFLLFLRHPDGILFKHLPEYKQELLQIYMELSYRETEKDILKSITDVTNPNKNLINEKCSRIKEAFIKLVNDDIAKYYYITGERGRAKKIDIDRDLVIWHQDANNLPPLKELSTAKKLQIAQTQAEKYLKERQFKKALHFFTQIIELGLANADNYCDRGVVNFELGNYEQSEADHTMNINLKPKTEVGYFNRAEARLMLKLYPEALVDITYHLKNINNEDANAYYLRGLIYEKMNDIKNACQNWFNAQHLANKYFPPLLTSQQDDIKNKLLQYADIQIVEPVFEKKNKSFW
ncbi:MAG: hypothetical protein EAZ85_02625 [Bacteroidetes bacterium]|nr:MAG: hypothetical protein EAZ85_02625 [Bacteroidota bacterium]TAG90243.1 MAG: hypothetical protein EAZ20_04840 [Bacteroidota bacterium]